MIESPPFEVGALKLTKSDWFALVMDVIVGAPDVVRGVAETLFDADPSPTELTARILTE